MRKLAIFGLLAFAHTAAYASVSVERYPSAEYAQNRVLQAHSGESFDVKAEPVDLTPTSKGYFAVYKAAKLNGVDTTLMLNMTRVESGGRCDAKGGNARGVLQVTPRTAKRFGITKEQLMDCNKGALAGVLEMKRLLELSDGDIRRALIGYKDGPSRMNRKRVSKDTRIYIQNVMGY